MRLVRFALLLALSLPALADDACPLPGATGGPAALLGPYPPAGSPEAAADLAVVLWEQRTRTPEEVARAGSEEELSLEDFAGALAPGFETGRHPRTEALLARAARAARPCIGAVKRAYARERPYVADARVAPAAERERTFSYPSGHATRGALFAAVLAELAPARREALLRRGAQIGEDRVIAGVHYPSDVAAGQRLGAEIARALLADRGFREALAQARALEWSCGGAGAGAAR